MSDQDENNDFEKNRIKWEFFKLHANQRVTFFRFYIGLVVTLFVSYFYVYDHLQNCHGTIFLYACLIMAGLSVSIMSYMFYVLDSRNVELINNAKNVLEEIKHLSVNDEKISFRHHQILRFVFFLIMVTGVILAFIGVLKFFYDSNECRSSVIETSASNERINNPPEIKQPQTKNPFVPYLSAPGFHRFHRRD